MWFLTSEIDSRILYIVPQIQELIIGRIGETDSSNIFVIADNSISRKHAVLTLLNNDLILQDLNSTYGTFLNNFEEKVKSNVAIKLSKNDVIRFGKLNSRWKVNQQHFITCTSTLKGDNLNSLKVCLEKLGGVLTSEWNDTCAYLTMPTITLTVKVVLALVHGAYIVTTEFWKQCLNSVLSQTCLPDPNNFIPEVVESTLNKEKVSFVPNEKRKEIFNRKKIIFFAKRQLEMYKSILINSSGIPLLLSESKLTKSMLCDSDVIVIQYNLTSNSQETESQRNQINDIVDYLKSKGKRVVADAEIGLAILYCSTSKYCNPDFSFSCEMIKQTSCNVSKSNNVLAQETEDQLHQGQYKKNNVIIEESLGSDMSKHNVLSNNENVSGAKRKLSTESCEILMNINKKQAVDCNKFIINNETNKRKLYDDTNDTNPNKKMAVNDSVEGNSFFQFKSLSTESGQVDINFSNQRLNLTKKLKRKIDSVNDDDLFPFIEKEKNSDEQSFKSNILIKGSHVTENLKNNKVLSEETEIDLNEKDLSSMRGAKLKELLCNASNALDAKSIKKEVLELEGKIDNLHLGTTIIKIRKDLIVKKEPLFIDESKKSEKNFKKFKKIWPLKMNVSACSKPSMNMRI